MMEIDLINLRVDLQEQAFSLFDQGKDKEASECMLKSAELGDVVSQYYVGCYYENGYGFKQDYLKAAEFYEKVSACREMVVFADPFMPLTPQCDAEFALGKLYERGLLPNSSMEKAIEWYEKAIADGSSDATFAFATRYVNELDFDRSAAYLLATAYGHPSEQLKKELFSLCWRLLKKETSYEVELLRLLAELYGKGWGTEINPGKAKEYFERAAIREKLIKNKFTWYSN